MIYSEKGNVKLNGDTKTLCLDLDLIFKAIRESYAEPNGNHEAADMMMMNVFEKSKNILPRTIIKIDREKG